ncbi:hypothetical protein JCM10914A_49160 [Paenibacillus sp. JCM 10914]|uniref:nucleotidyltransferase domain-containing protein n=1 Tax=Paenibacillus sp. JCM 10914 TaxID=1236974 RepID=UPI0003CCB202|nr:nucleotidyltransferase domain-containing protein [Paenibacillus sp. JCM 10914]GAE06396.1 hypothetical protein JCM10914_2553 [Paenibacillus sp. JCM 10914]
MHNNLQAGYGLDSNGYIVSDVSIDKISSAYDECIQESVEQLLKLFPNTLHSLYAYGSVARGEAVVGKSDLDLLVVFHHALSSTETAELKALANALSEKYITLIRDVGIAVTTTDHVLDPANYDEQAFIRELCVSVHGPDIREHFGPYKLTPEIAISFNGDIAGVLARAISRLESATNEEFKTVTKNFARKLIRTSYSMVMARSQIWTTRLHEQSDVFVQYFQDKEPVIRTLQKWVEQPPTNREQVFKLFISEGEWLTANFEREARII